MLKIQFARGELPAHRLGRRARIRRSDFDSFLERTRIEPTQPEGEQPWGGEKPPRGPKSDPAKGKGA